MSFEISVVLIVKNGEKYLQEAIESVSKQTLSPSEIIAIDGHSSDQTSNIIKRYKKINYFLQGSSGIANAYNEGITKARFPIITFISCDDLWMLDKLKVQRDALERNEHLSYVVSYAEHFSNCSVLPPGFREELIGKPVPAYIMETLMIKKEVFERIGFLNSEYPVGEDVDFFSRMIDHSIPGKIIEKVLVKKRIHEKNSSISPAINNSSLLIKVARQSIMRKRNLKSPK